MSISVVMPFWSYGPEADAMLANCVVRINYDELVLVVNEPNERGEPLIAKRVNQGLRLAHGDYLIVMMSSAMLDAGSLHDLCQPDAITSPSVNGVTNPFHGCCFCIPREIYQQYGGMDEAYTAFFVDNDFVCRMITSGVPIRCVPTVEVTHLGGQAHSKLNVGQLMDANRDTFLQRWRAVDAAERMMMEQLGK